MQTVEVGGGGGLEEEADEEPVEEEDEDEEARVGSGAKASSRLPEEPRPPVGDKKRKAGDAAGEGKRVKGAEGAGARTGESYTAPECGVWVIHTGRVWGVGYTRSVA